MRIALRPNAETAFVVSGLLVVLIFWIADLIAALSGLGEHGHGGAGDFTTRITVTFFGVGFALIGVVYEQHPRFLSDALWTTRYAAGYLLVIDGMFHLFAFNDHLDHPFNAAVFGIVAPVQIAAGIALPRFRTLDWAWLLLTIGLIGAYVATRVTVVWPLDEIEEVDLLGVTSKFVEAATLVALAPLLRGGQKEPTASTTPTAKS